MRRGELRGRVRRRRSERGDGDVGTGEKTEEEGLFEEHFGKRALSEVWASGTQGAEHSSLRPCCNGRD